MSVERRIGAPIRKREEKALLRDWEQLESPSMPKTKLKEPKTLEYQPRRKRVGRPLKNPPPVMCVFCGDLPACWQRPIRMADGELLVHCDSKPCDQAYLKLAYKTRLPFRQEGHLHENSRTVRYNHARTAKQKEHDAHRTKPGTGSR